MISELKLMKHAKRYLDELALGIDPLSGRELPAGDIVNNEKISKCFCYVSGILQRVIDAGGIRAEAGKKGKTPFAIPPEERSRYPFEESSPTISRIAQRLNELVDLETMQKLKITSISTFLMRAGLLFEEEGPDGAKNKRPTEAGRKLGISTVVRSNQSGEYRVVVYSQEAQQFILENLDRIAAINAEPLHKNEGLIWTAEEDDWLRRADASGVELKEMSAQLERPRAEVRTRLAKLGLAESGDRHADS